MRCFDFEGSTSCVGVFQHRVIAALTSQWFLVAYADWLPRSLESCFARARERRDLTTKLGTFGADAPSTAMQWKREGNELEWIVRQMSWKPPWTNCGQDNIKRDVRNPIAIIHPIQTGRTLSLTQPFTSTNPVDALR